MTLTTSAMMLIMDAMAMMYTKTRYAYTGEVPAVSEVEEVVRANFIEFCDDAGIDDIQDDDAPDFPPDDVDESNYNPYMGCDDDGGDCYTYEDLGAGWY